MLTRLIVAIITQDIHILHHYTVQPKQIQCHINCISVEKEDYSIPQLHLIPENVLQIV